jgi:hypothetical protein
VYTVRESSDVKNGTQPKLNIIEQRVIKSYEINGKCQECEEYCREKRLPLHGPLSFFNIGKEFEMDRYGIVFVGKTTWYSKSDVEELKFLYSKFRDCRNDCREMFEDCRSRFWGCIRDIAEQLYPEGGNDVNRLLNHIAITNLTKCNTTLNYPDTTPYQLTENCIEIFEQEIKALQPKHIIFFTGTGYDRYISGLKFGHDSYHDMTVPTDKREITDRKEVRNKCVWWWHRKFYENDEMRMHFLRTRHPQGAPREFVDEIVKWVKETVVSSGSI